MASFKTAQASLVEAKYEGGIKVFLESAEDVRIFADHWFSHTLDRLQFVSAEGEQSGGGGCQVVIAKVKGFNDKGMTAYGIVDRDVLLGDKKPDLFWEADDEKFHAASPYGDNIHVLRCWELENYLLKPEAFCEEISRRASRTPAPVVTAETFLEYAEDIVQLTALIAFLVSAGKSSPSTGFGLNSSNLANDINQYLTGLFPGEASVNAEEETSKVRAFQQDTDSPKEQWGTLVRMLDGKRTLMRLCHHLSSSLGLHSIRPWEEMRGCLANIIASKGLVDSELTELIDDISAKSLRNDS